jgi:putative acetyltransferase
MMVEIREEKQSDRDAIHKLNMTAFDSGSEANLVDKLRLSCKDYLSFVAIEDGVVVGHILFTPVTVDGCIAKGMGLAPMAVLPSHQRKGIGSNLVSHGLEFLRTNACPFVIVLGHPEYYPRFGFELASKFGLKCQWEWIPNEAFMIVIFDNTILPETGGTVRYVDEFNEDI